MPNLNEELLFSVRADGVPFLKDAETPERFIEVAQMLAENSKSPYAQQAAAYILAQIGNTRGAIRAIDQLMKLLITGAAWEGEIAVRAEKLRSLLLSDPVAAKSQLAEWEAESMRNLGLTETKLKKAR
jgi:hypothetical protein